MKVVALCCLAVTVVSSAAAYQDEVRTLSTAIAEQIASAGKKNIAVIDLTDLEGNVTELGRFLAEEFATSLAGNGKAFTVVERNNLKVILQEHQLATTGIIDPATAKRLGQIAGVDALVTGTLTPFADSVHLSMKILEASTAKIVGAVRGDIPKTDTIDDLLRHNLAQNNASPSAPVHQNSTPVQQNIARESPPPATNVVDQNDLRFTLSSCDLKSSGRVICTLAVTNTAPQERQFELQLAIIPSDQSPVSLYDANGAQYRPSLISIGTQRAEARFLGMPLAKATLTPGIPVRITIVFDSVDRSVSTASIRLSGDVRGVHDQMYRDERVVAVFRDIGVRR